MSWEEDIMEVTGVGSDAAGQYLISALEATSALLPKGMDRTAVVVALIEASSRYDAAMSELIGVQQTIAKCRQQKAKVAA